jgi:hypothetical protein
MALVTEFHQFPEIEFLGAPLLPKRFGRFVTFGGGFVKGVGRLTEIGIDGNDGSPRD